MARYRYAGPGPVEDITSGEVIHPGDEREFDQEPAWGPWELLDEPGEPQTAPESPQTAPATPAPAPAPVSPPAASTAPPAPSSAPAPPKEM